MADPVFELNVTETQFNFSVERHSFEMAQSGVAGPALELQTSATHIQYRAIGSDSWINLVALADLGGPAGPSIEMQTTSTHIQYRVVGGSSWADIIALSELTGEAGLAATISVGSVTTGAPGSSASVTNTGSSSAAVLDFAIPRGASGIDGVAATISVGSVTTGVPGSSAAVTNAGTANAAVFAFTIPRGDTGAQGATEYVGNIDGGNASSTYGDLPSIDGGGAAG